MATTAREGALPCFPVSRAMVVPPAAQLSRPVLRRGEAAQEGRTMTA